MSIEAQQVQYKQQFLEAFEVRSSVLKVATTKEVMISGNQATFLISGSGGDAAVTRGTNGQIPYGNPTNTQVTVTLVEKHAPYEMTGFNIFASQGDQKRIMQMDSMAVINRDMDYTILAELENATVNLGAAAPFTLPLIARALAKLGSQAVDTTDANKMFGIMSPAAQAYAYQMPTFTSGDYVDVKPLVGPARKMWRWMGINWMVTPLVTNMGTNNESMFIWNSDALGYAVNVGEDSIHVGYDEKQDVSWSRATVFHAAKILQNSGIVKIVHDGSAYA